MNRDDVEVLETRLLYKGFFTMNRYLLRHRLFAGGWSPPLSREVFERGPVAAAIPYDPTRDEVVLIEQFRTGPAAARYGRPWMIEIVAGILEGDETPEALAYRETVEETGLHPSALEPITSFFMAPGGSTEYCTLLCCRVDSSMAGGIHGNDAEGEDIRVFAEPLDQAYARVESGEIASSFSIIALQWLMLNRDRVRARWT